MTPDYREATGLDHPAQRYMSAGELKLERWCESGKPKRLALIALIALATLFLLVVPAGAQETYGNAGASHPVNDLSPADPLLTTSVKLRRVLMVEMGEKYLALIHPYKKIVHSVSTEEGTSPLEYALRIGNKLRKTPDDFLAILFVIAGLDLQDEADKAAGKENTQ